MRLRLLWMASSIASAIASAQGLEFEAASVRGPASPEVNLMRGGPGTSDPERISYTHVRLGTIVRAFALKPNELIGPDWLVDSNIAYDVEAKLPADATKEQASEMMQNLLKARFHLVYHFEKRSFDAFNLVLAKGGAKLKPAAPAQGPAPADGDPEGFRAPAAKDRDGFPILPPGIPNFQGQGGSDGHLRTTARALEMSRIAEFLQFDLRSLYQVNYLIDKTGLAGTYDFKLDRSNRSPGLESSAPDFFTAVEQQLGLKFEKTKVDAQVMVIDHIDKTPTEN
jgi:uncharacterized protein (TIGR03435 family)